MLNFWETKEKGKSRYKNPESPHSHSSNSSSHSNPSSSTHKKEYKGDKGGKGIKPDKRALIKVVEADKEIGKAVVVKKQEKSGFWTEKETDDNKSSVRFKRENFLTKEEDSDSGEHEDFLKLKTEMAEIKEDNLEKDKKITLLISHLNTLEADFQDYKKQSIEILNAVTTTLTDIQNRKKDSDKRKAKEWKRIQHKINTEMHRHRSVSHVEENVEEIKDAEIIKIVEEKEILKAQQEKEIEQIEQVKDIVQFVQEAEILELEHEKEVLKAEQVKEISQLETQEEILKSEQAEKILEIEHIQAEKILEIEQEKYDLENEQAKEISDIDLKVKNLKAEQVKEIFDIEYIEETLKQDQVEEIQKIEQVEEILKSEQIENVLHEKHEKVEQTLHEEQEKEIVKAEKHTNDLKELKSIKLKFWGEVVYPFGKYNVDKYKAGEDATFEFKSGVNSYYAYGEFGVDANNYTIITINEITTENGKEVNSKSLKFPLNLIHVTDVPQSNFSHGSDSSDSDSETVQVIPSSSLPPLSKLPPLIRK